MADKMGVSQTGLDLACAAVNTHSPGWLVNTNFRTYLNVRLGELIVKDLEAWRSGGRPAATITILR